MPLCVIPSLRVETSIAGPLATWEPSLEGWAGGVNIMVYRETDTQYIRYPLQTYLQ